MDRSSLLLRFAPAGGLALEPSAVVSDPRLCLEAENLHPAPRVLSAGECRLILLGDPIADGRRDDAAVLAAFEAAGDLESFARALNGSFLVFVYRPDDASLAILNDRFASLALFHDLADGCLSASLSFKQLLDRRRAAGRARIAPEAVYQFLALRRMLGEATWDPEVRYLPSASVLRFDGKQPEPAIARYWQPDYEVQAPRGPKLVDALADGLKQALALALSDERRFALFLSGGLDSRALLAAAPRALPCVTTALHRNNEVAVAEAVAASAGASFRFVERPAELHEARLDDAAFLTGGMQVYSETQFLGYGPTLAESGDCFLLGLGLDIFFGGLYLPKTPVTLFDRPALHHRLLPLSGDLAGDYLGGVKYRLRSSDPLAIVRPDRRAAMTDALRAAVEGCLARGRALGAEGYDLWEYMHLHNLSRHYSFPMMSSVRTYAECRSPALENDLFDLAIALTAEQKLDGTAYQDAIAKLNPALMAVRNANTNLPAAWSLRRQTAAKAMAMLGNRLFGTVYPQSPGWQERSWPSPQAALAAQPGLLARARSLPGSAALASLDLFEPAALSAMLAAHEAGRHDHAVLINLLLTIESCLSTGL